MNVPSNSVNRPSSGSARGYHELRTSLGYVAVPGEQSTGQSAGLVFCIAAYVENSLFCRCPVVSRA